MKIAIGVNHSWPHIGGSEKVVQQIAEHMVHDFGYQCDVYTFSLQKQKEHNGVRYIPAQRGQFFNLHIDKHYDHLLVYSDYFYNWPNILTHEFERTKVSIVLVGMNMMMKSSSTMSKFIKRRKDFNIVTHSDNYQDYKECERRGINPVVIPNGIDLDEFDIEEGLFKNKYGIKGPMVLNVSNFFHGKGQEYLPRILDECESDFTLVQISSTIQYPMAQMLEVSYNKKMSGRKSLCLKDIDRKWVTSAFKDADVFVFPSQTEVAPLVVLEAMASKTPWLALPVGNVRKLSGGKIIPTPGKGAKGFLQLDQRSINEFAENIDILVKNPEKRLTISEEGYNMIESDYNWEVIADQYNNLFKGEING